MLVAKGLIPKGTSGTVIAEKGLFQAATLPKDDLKIGAISDPAYLNGRVAVADIFPGQQITTADVSAGLTDAIPTQLSGKQRAVAITIGAVQGLVGYVANGDHVDVYYQTGSSDGAILGLLEPNVTDHARRQPGDHPRRRGARAEARPRVRVAGRCGSSSVPPAMQGRPPKRSITSTDLQEQINRQPKTREVAGPWIPRSEQSSPSKGSMPSTCSAACPTTRASSSWG